MTAPPATATAPPVEGVGRGTIWAWLLLDWAASAFSTVLITLVVAYVDTIVFAKGAWGMPAGVVWAWTLAAAMLTSAILTPWLAAWSDRHDAHQRSLTGGVFAGAGGLIAMAAVPETWQPGVIATIIVAAVGFDVAQVFTGSLLPRIATGPRADRLSAGGFALGYAGGAMALVAATTIVMAHDRLGLSVAGGIRAAFCFTGCWWLLFSVPALRARFPQVADHHAASSAAELVAFARQLAAPAADGRSHPLARTLGGGMLVLGAVQTAIGQFSSIALEEFHLDSVALVRLVLLVQAVALPGALGIGWLSGWWGRSRALAGCVAGWTAVLLLAWLVDTTWELYGLAVLLALVLGGVQSSLRATVAAATPPGRGGATFGLLQVGTKLSGAAANLGFGAALVATGNGRAGLLILVVQILAGWWMLGGGTNRTRA